MNNASLCVDYWSMRQNGETWSKAVDLSRMVFRSAEYNGVCLLVDPPLVVTPYPDEDTGQLYVAVDASTTLHAFAYTREQLVEEINEQIVFLWKAYAQEDPEMLSASARKLRDVLRTRLRQAA